MRDVHRYQITGKLYCNVSINYYYSIIGFEGIAGTTSLLASSNQGREAVYTTTKKLDNAKKMQAGCLVCAKHHLPLKMVAHIPLKKLQ